MASKQFELKGLKEKRGKIKSELEKLGSKLRAEERAMSAEEKTTFDQLKADFTTVNQQMTAVAADISALEDLLNTDGEAADAGDGGGDPPPAPAQNSGRAGIGRHDSNPRRRVGTDGATLAQSRADRSLAFKAWARKQHRLPLTRAMVEACKRTGLNPTAREFCLKLNRSGPRGIQTRDASVGTNSAGGYTVKQEFSDQLEKLLKDFSAVRGVVDVFRTDTGALLPWPTADDTGNTGELMTENAAGTSADVTFGVVNFNGYKYGTKAMLVSYELLNDSAFDIESFLAETAGERLGRAQGPHFTTGTGSSQPKGIVTCASAGLTTALATAITADELINLIYKVDPAYRNSPSVAFMMHDAIIAYVSLLKDSTGRPLLRESYGDGVDLTIQGYKVAPNMFMASTVATTNVTALFGDMSKFKIRDVGEVRFRRLDERYAEKDQTGFLGFLRSDSNCTNGNAIKKLTQA
jgi:HK97 family phage major capsid protein